MSVVFSNVSGAVGQEKSVMAGFNICKGYYLVAKWILVAQNHYQTTQL